jgi:hypothetical protein
MLTLVADDSFTRNVYNVDVKVQGFITVDKNGKKTYTRSLNRDFIIDRAQISLEFLISSLKSEISLGSNQCISLWVYDKRLGEDILLESEYQIADVLNMYEVEKHLMLVASITIDNEEPKCVITPEGQQASASVEAECAIDDDEYELELPNVFDIFEEYVGVDDEYIYGINPNRTSASAAIETETATPNAAADVGAISASATAEPAPPNADNEPALPNAAGYASHVEPEINDVDTQMSDPGSPGWAHNVV